MTTTTNPAVTPSTNGSTSSSGTVPGSVTYRTVNNNGSGQPSTTSGGAINWSTISGNGVLSGTGWTIGSSAAGAGVTASSTLASPVAKTNLSYLIIKNDGSVLEFEEQNPLSAKELIGITKFFAAISKVGFSGVAVRWTDLIANLGIQRHFKPGTSDISVYDSSGQTYYVKLVDAR